MREPPHACRPRHVPLPHVARSTRVVGKRGERKIAAVKTAPPARAPFWAWPNNVSRLCMAQARGLLSVYKSRGTPLYPFTCARAVGAAHHSHTKQGRGREPERSRSTRWPRQHQDQRYQRARGRGGLPQQGPCRGCRGCPGKGLAEGAYFRGSLLRPSVLCVLGLGVALGFSFSPAPLLCPA